MNVFLSILSVVLFILNYPIAEYLAPWDINPDNNLAVRFNIYAIIMLICSILTIMEHNKWSRFFVSILIGLCIGDVLDRFFFDCTVFMWNDIIMIIITILTSFYKHVYVRQRR